MCFKTLITLFSVCCFFPQFLASTPKRTTDNFMKCGGQYGIKTAEDEDKAAKAISNGTLTDDQRCYWVCVLTELGEINKDGTLNESYAVPELLRATQRHRNDFPEEKIKSDVAECAKKESEEKCGTSFERWRCLYSLSVKMYLKILEN